MQVLEHDDGRPERSEQLTQRPEEPVALGPAISQRLGRLREPGGELGQQRAQRADDRRQPPGREACTADRLDHGAERKGFAQLVTCAQVPVSRAQLRGVQELLDETRLADTRLSLDDRERRRAPGRLEQEPELPFAADQDRGREASGRRLVLRRVAAAVYPCRR
jgi:hypothetical protein